jgi:hypothetical protein
MDVFLVPAGGDRYALYCEVSAPLPDVAAPPRTIRGRLVNVFRRVLAEGEAARRHRPPASATRTGRLRAAVTRRLAEAVAEQRLLWYLRGRTEARFVPPDDLGAPASAAIRRDLLTHDRDRHRRWTIVDGALGLASAPVALLPGPNVLAYYFIFRSVGHFLSWRGASQGLLRIAWTEAPSPELTRLRHALSLDPAARAAAIDAVADALGLERLRGFLDRVG